MIRDQFLAIPPDHSSAKEFYDLQCIESTFISLLNPTGPHYDAAKQDEYRKVLGLVDDRIGILQGQYRHERGADASCRVGLTRGPNGFPVVDGRPRNGTPVLMSGEPLLTVVRN